MHFDLFTCRSGGIRMEQFRFAIVEDEAPHAQLLQQHIESWHENRNRGNALVRCFDNAAAFLFDWEEECYDMIFLDIQMPGIDGMETARRIRETDRGVKLVFTTGITDYLQEGYEVEAIRYLLKPITKEKVWECLDKLLQDPAPAVLLFQTQEGMVKVPERDIAYFEARGHYTICHLAAGKHAGLPAGTETEQDMVTPVREQELQLREGFNTLCDRLSQRPFVRCHRSYLCHISYIHRVERAEIILESGSRIPVSRRLYESVIKAFISYFRKEES